MSFFATAPQGLEDLLTDELKSLGVSSLKTTVAGVHFEAKWPVLYRLLLWSRLANRIYMPLISFSASSQDELYDAVYALDWRRHIGPKATLAVEAHVSDNPELNHSKFVALKVKDAIVDRLRELRGSRPDVDREHPDVSLSLRLKGVRAELSLDLSGGSLHQRGYRIHAGEAPLKENLAAALLIRAGWPEIAKRGGSLVDPMCGSGTFLAEGLMMALDIAPGLERGRFGVRNWPGFEPTLWQEAKAEAQARRAAGLAGPVPKVQGFDRDNEILAVAMKNLERAGLSDFVRLAKRPMESWREDQPPIEPAGLLICNPPYGERLGDLPELVALYDRFGQVLRTHFAGWKASIFLAQPSLGMRLGMRAKRLHKFFNGRIPCELVHFEIPTLAQQAAKPLALERMTRGGEPAALDDVDEGSERAKPNELVEPNELAAERSKDGGQVEPVEERRSRLSEGATMFRNRLLKNLKYLRKWAARNQFEAYRVYDADLPDYNVAVDLYGSHAVIQEYAAPSDIDPAKAERRLHEVLLAVPELLEIQATDVVLKVRKRQRGRDQYTKQGASERAFVVHEAGAAYWVNIQDYLDTGLFLDHRPIRQWVRANATGKRFLNLFAYTGSVSVAAALGGAKSVVTVDLSQTYLEWAERNFKLNRLRGDYRFLREDCIEGLPQLYGRYELIFIDPPSFSNSKSMNQDFEVQADQGFLFEQAERLLATQGLVIFSNNLRSFQLDREALERLDLVAIDKTAPSIPRDYQRDPKIHQCWFIHRRGETVESIGKAIPNPR